MPATLEQIQALAAKVNALSPPERLRLAAGLLENRMGPTALIIIRNVADELAAAILLSGRN
jgi:hypothetical protein